jgi:hypothetical protein
MHLPSSTQDFELLNDGNWLNDTLIEFVYEHLENAWKSSPRKVAFLRPAIVHLLAHAAGIKKVVEVASLPNTAAHQPRSLTFCSTFFQLSQIHNPTQHQTPLSCNLSLRAFNLIPKISFSFQ